MAIIKLLNLTFIFSCKVHSVFLNNVASSKELSNANVYFFSASSWFAVSFSVFV